MGLLRKYFNQTNRPEGTLGKMMIRGMNSGHGAMADWGMSHLGVSSPAQITDLGCGGSLRSRGRGRRVCRCGRHL